MISTRYKVIEKPGGLGEVVQVAVKEIGVNTGENTPALFVSPLQTFTTTMGVNSRSQKETTTCAACARRQERMFQLEMQLQQLETQLHVNNILNALMNSMEAQGTAAGEGAGGDYTSRPHGARRRLQRQSSPLNQEKEDEEPNETLLEMMREEFKRQDLLHALMDLMERPTYAERQEIKKFVPKNVKALLFTPSKNVFSIPTPEKSM
ncbi:hypothetical protein ECC02_003054 [Trypanosoma cruzi]|uniref:Uncharacterized protein n=1 Tax=Trypanosoma cruzi TaxID=5693 RepID=A0A7J6YBS0_TRYCR|nr:hypothetical protein ECC02_003054 [Trypanosoma cruzi]